MKLVHTCEVKFNWQITQLEALPLVMRSPSLKSLCVCEPVDLRDMLTVSGHTSGCFTLHASVSAAASHLTQRPLTRTDGRRTQCEAARLSRGLCRFGTDRVNRITHDLDQHAKPRISQLGRSAHNTEARCFSRVWLVGLNSPNSHSAYLEHFDH